MTVHQPLWYINDVITNKIVKMIDVVHTSSDTGLALICQYANITFLTSCISVIKYKILYFLGFISVFLDPFTFWVFWYILQTTFCHYYYNFFYTPVCLFYAASSHVCFILIEKSSSSCRSAFCGPQWSRYLSVKLSHDCLGGSIQTQAEGGWHAWLRCR